MSSPRKLSVVIRLEEIPYLFIFFKGSNSKDVIGNSGNSESYGSQRIWELVNYYQTIA